MHYEQMYWPQRGKLKPGSRNVLHKSLVDRDKLLLPRLHIKLGLMKKKKLYKGPS